MRDRAGCNNGNAVALLGVAVALLLMDVLGQFSGMS